MKTHRGVSKKDKQMIFVCFFTVPHVFVRNPLQDSHHPKHKIKSKSSANYLDSPFSKKVKNKSLSRKLKSHFDDFDFRFHYFNSTICYAKFNFYFFYFCMEFNYDLYQTNSHLIEFKIGVTNVFQANVWRVAISGLPYSYENDVWYSQCSSRTC